MIIDEFHEHRDRTIFDLLAAERDRTIVEGACPSCGKRSDCEAWVLKYRTVCSGCGAIFQMASK